MNASSPRVLFVHEYTLRPRHPNEDFERALLKHLHARGWQGAPVLYGRDHEDRLIHSVLRGTAIHDGRHLDDEYLAGAARLVRELHDLTAKTPLAGDQETVCHNSLDPRHTISQKGVPYAFVDWEAAAPGARLHDVADLCWRFVRPGPGAEEAPRRMRLVCDTYGLADRGQLVEAIMWRQDRRRQAIEAGARAGDPRMRALHAQGAAVRVRDQFLWVRENYRELTGAVGT